MKKRDEQETAFFNIVQFVNDPKLWMKRKKEVKKWIEQNLEKKIFFEKHLSENFKNFYPSKDVLDFMHKPNMHCWYDRSSENFHLKFHFTVYENQPDKLIEFVVRLKDVETSPKIKNKGELKNYFQRLMYCVGFEIGFLQAYIDRIDTDIAVLNNDRDTIKVTETIFDVEKIFYENTVKIVEHYPVHYPMLFQFEKYIKNLEMKKNDVLPFEEKKIISLFYQHITDISNYDKKTVGQRYREFERKNLIPDFSKKSLPMN